MEYMYFIIICILSNFVALESELLKSIEPEKPVQPKLQPLENILASMKFTTTTLTTGQLVDEKLSKEATEVIEILPSLNFMTAKVLMFPVEESLDDT